MMPVSPISQSAAHTFLFGLLLGYTLFKINSERDKLKKIRNGNNLKEKYPAPRRFGAAIRLQPDQYRRYRELHDAVWKDVLDRMYHSNIRNFVIYYHEETRTLFQHFEWIGHWNAPAPMNPIEEQRLFETDMLAIANDPIIRIWWKECEPCQDPFSQWAQGDMPPSEGGNGDWWAPMIPVTHCGHWSVAYSSQDRDPDFEPMDPKE
jgi:L-rhamnose mutarotase